MEDSGMVKRIRGTACSIRVSPAIANRIVESTKSVLLKFLPDVYIYIDHRRGSISGKSPGIEIICIYIIITYYFILLWISHL